MIEIAIGLIGLGIAIYEYLQNRRSRKDLETFLSMYEEKAKADRELLKTIAENTERYNDLLPLVKPSVQSDSKIEDYIFKQPRISDLLKETSSLKTYKLGDLLNEDVFVADKQTKVSDLLKIEILSPSQ
jgi:Zn-dependent M32 family carboxypeptidase